MSTGAIYPDLADKTVLVTGGGSGIGEAIVRRFAAQGSKTAFIDIKQAESRALAEELTAQGQHVHFEQADLTDIAALRSAIGDDPQASSARSRFSSTTRRTMNAMRRWRSRRNIGTSALPSI